MRQIILDTETTGLDSSQGHRIIEIGCVELINRRPTGRDFHRYLNPERDVEAAAQAIHGLSRERLSTEPRFAEVAEELIGYLRGAELVMHNAAFDVAFLNAELARLPGDPTLMITAFCTVLDTLALAREMHPGQRNSLDALCRRYGVDNSNRELHGALLDARILADVYLIMTGGQSALALGGAERTQRHNAGPEGRSPVERSQPLIVRHPNAAEHEAHERLLTLLDKMSSGKTLWRTQAEAQAGSAKGNA